MAKARAIVKRRKSVRNIRKITKTMQMIATAKFQKSVKRALGGKPYTLKVHEIVGDLVLNVQDFRHPLLERGEGHVPARKVAVIVLSSNRGLAGSYNGSILRKAIAAIRELEADGNQVDIYSAGKKGASFFAFQKRQLVLRLDQFVDQPKFSEIGALADQMIQRYINGEVDAVHVAYTDFISTGMQRPAFIRLLPLEGVAQSSQHLMREMTESSAVFDRVGQKGGAAVEVAQQERRLAQMEGVRKSQSEHEHVAGGTLYDFSPSAKELLDELLPMTVRLTLYQCFLDAASSENVARMVSMKSATDNADKMIKTLTMQYNRARQSQITTELSEIMGGVEAMKS